VVNQGSILAFGWETEENHEKSHSGELVWQPYNLTTSAKLFSLK
jgi:hypothetical protein